MISLMEGRGRFPWTAFALALGIWSLSGSSALAQGEMYVGPGPVPAPGPAAGPHAPLATMPGVPGVGGPMAYAGFQGFGIGYHLGYGYGGNGVGVGPDGGYPFYGGPGYPHPWPQLRRIGGINPFPYYGGPGFPTPSCPNYFGSVGPLVADQPVITIGSDSGDASYATGYGAFTGTLPYPETAFAPFTTSAAAGGSESGVIYDKPSQPSMTPPPAVPEPPATPAMPDTNPTPGAASTNPRIPAGHVLGIDAEPVVDAQGTKGVKVAKVYAGTVAEKAGLRAGDVIESSNGYVTAKPTNVAWVINHAAPDRVLNMNVRSVVDGQVHTVKAQLP